MRCSYLNQKQLSHNVYKIFGLFSIAYDKEKQQIVTVIILNQIMNGQRLPGVEIETCGRKEKVDMEIGVKALIKLGNGLINQAHRLGNFHPPLEVLPPSVLTPICNSF